MNNQIDQFRAILSDMDINYDSLRETLIRYGVTTPFDYRTAYRFNQIIDIYLDYHHEPFHKYSKVKSKCYICGQPVVRLQAFGNRKFCCFECKVKRNKLYTKSHPGIKTKSL